MADPALTPQAISPLTPSPKKNEGIQDPGAKIKELSESQETSPLSNSPNKEVAEQLGVRIKDLDESQSELLSKIQGMKQNVQSWRSMMETQLKSYKDELSRLKKQLETELEELSLVYMTTIDSQQQKVAVTGNVEPDALIKKLIKIGKHAELWPDQPKPNNNGGGGGGKKSKNKNNNDKTNNNNTSKQPNNEPSDNQETKEQGEEDSSAAETKTEPLESVKNSGKDSPVKAADATATPEKPAGKKKGKKGNNNGGDGNANGGGGGYPAPPPPAAAADNQKIMPPPRDPVPMYPLPPAAAAVPQYLVSYSTMQPLAAGSYYVPMEVAAAAVPQYLVSYSTMQPLAAGSYYVPTEAAAAARARSYDFFSEENANACSVM